MQSTIPRNTPSRAFRRWLGVVFPEKHPSLWQEGEGLEMSTPQLEQLMHLGASMPVRVYGRTASGVLAVEAQRVRYLITPAGAVSTDAAPTTAKGGFVLHPKEVERLEEMSRYGWIDLQGRDWLGLLVVGFAAEPEWFSQRINKKGEVSTDGLTRERAWVATYEDFWEVRRWFMHVYGKFRWGVGSSVDLQEALHWGAERHQSA
jgi:hypothetical protein